ncbi:N-acetyltransferase [Burkholderia sp. Bp8963]|uniref:GNAT family N-acetyltransferase n=1 Tax=Burkholderia sp. Bp8963 TaxID=2184547 RepID=UPI000F5A7081|nr:GNAT family N-acetyltransferase [Burkholderia sp. Bp8963]RQS65527.1 N-acetyltransferase [Burkholderia sp. Bp8963]
MNVTFATTTHSDADLLVQIRIAAMQESLERIGRFDPQRAGDRFLSSFDPAFCRLIVVDGVNVGFVLAKPADDHLALEHLYIVPVHQGRGIGSAVLAAIFADADSRSLPVKVGALRDSDSNRFYQRHGFRKVEEAEWDIYYLRAPQATRET